MIFLRMVLGLAVKQQPQGEPRERLGQKATKNTLPVANSEGPPMRGPHRALNVNVACVERLRQAIGRGPGRKNRTGEKTGARKMKKTT